MSAGQTGGQTEEAHNNEVQITDVQSAAQRKSTGAEPLGNSASESGWEPNTHPERPAGSGYPPSGAQVDGKHALQEIKKRISHYLMRWKAGRESCNS